MRPRPRCYVDLSGLPGLPEPTPEALYRWQPMSVPRLSQAGLRRRNQELGWAQAAQGCKGAGEVGSSGRHCLSGAETICPFGCQAGRPWRGTKKLRTTRPPDCRGRPCCFIRNDGYRRSASVVDSAQCGVARDRHCERSHASASVDAIQAHAAQRALLPLTPSHRPVPRSDAPPVA